MMVVPCVRGHGWAADERDGEGKRQCSEDAIREGPPEAMMARHPAHRDEEEEHDGNERRERGQQQL